MTPSKTYFGRVIISNKPQQINESVQHTANAGGGVDYTALKAIIKECIEEYFEKHPINEGTLAGITLEKGKISLVGNKGRLFGAKLVLEGNINDSLND